MTGEVGSGLGVLYSGAGLTDERVFSATDETQGVTVTDDLAWLVVAHNGCFNHARNNFIKK